MKHFDLLPPAEKPSVAAPRGAWARLRVRYGSADPRSLGLFRIALGTLLAVDVWLKFPDAAAHFSNAGWLPNHYALFRPMSEHVFSVYFAFGSPLEVQLLLSLHLLVCLLLLVGYRTKLMQILALVLTTSLNSRNLLIENGGMVVLNLLLVWTVFLPLGRRFGVDAWRRAWTERQETSVAALNERLDPPRDSTPVSSLAVTALLLQWAVIYAFNTLHKHGAPWRDGTAVYYFFQQDRLITDFGAWLRDVLPLGAFKFFTFATLAIEGVLPLLLLSPLRPRFTRMLAFGLVALLHVAIDSVLQLGAFSWAMLVVYFVFVPREAWDAAAGYFRARRVPCVLHFNPQSGASLALCRVVKRLDALGLVTFRELDEASPKKTAQSLCVSVNGEKSAVGWDAVLALGDALWFGRRPLWLLGPLLRTRITRRLAQLATEPQRLDQDFGLEHLPTQAEERASEPSGARLLLRRIGHDLAQLGVALLLLICGWQVLLENPAVPQQWKPNWRPALFELVVAYPRIFQGWSMFAPAPPMSEARLVIDGRTRDGRRLDPLTGAPPVFEVHPAGTPRMNLLWGYFHVRIGEERFRAYWNGVKDFVATHHKLSGRPQDALESFEAFYVTQTFPAPGAKRAPPERRKLFSSGPLPSDSATPSGRSKSKAVKPRAQ